MSQEGEQELARWRLREEGLFRREERTCLKVLRDGKEVEPCKGEAEVEPFKTSKTTLP